MSKYAFPRCALGLAIGASLATESAAAATITVTTAADGPIGTVAGCSLREAIASANSGNSQGGCASGSIAADSIVFDGSLAQSTITLSEGSMGITNSLTITGPVADDPSGLIIDGDNLSRIFDIEGESDSSRINTTLERMTLTRGRATGSNERGGAIRGQYVNLNLQQTLITGNSVSVSSDQGAMAAAYGGGLSVFYGSASISDSRIVDNHVASHASGDYSSSVAAGSGVLVAFGTASLVNTAVEDNHAESDSSGTDSFSSASGGVFIANLFSAVSAVVVNSSISRNSAQALASGSSADSISTGGGITINSGTDGNVAIVGSTLADNSLIADEPVGGGILNRSANVTLLNSTVSGNSLAGPAARGSGIAVIGFDSDPGHLLLKHSTVAFNTTSNSSEAIHLNQGASADSSLELEASMVVQGSTSETACNVAADSASNSLVTDASCTGAATSVSDIKLTGMSDNGGRTLTHGLLPGSVAIDAVSPCLPDPAVDQRGLPRPGTGSSDCDIGALEVQQDDDFDALFGDRFEQ